MEGNCFFENKLWCGAFVFQWQHSYCKYYMHKITVNIIKYYMIIWTQNFIYSTVEKCYTNNLGMMQKKCQKLLEDCGRLHVIHPKIGS